MESYPRKLTLPGMVAERFTCGPPPSSSGPKKLDQGPRNPGPGSSPLEHIFAPIWAVPSLARLAGTYYANTARNVALTVALVDVLKGLAAHAITAIPFKGPVLASLAYGGLSLRAAGDLDILVPRTDAIKAKDLLISRGYHPHYELTDDQEFARSHHFLLMRDQGAIAVEVHWRLSEASFGFGLSDDDLWRKPAHSRLSGVDVTVLPTGELLLYLCAHGAKHYWERLSWICDVAELIRNDRAIEWEPLVRQARAIGAARMLSVGLLLARELLGAALPKAILRGIEADAPAVSLAREACARNFPEIQAPPGLGERQSFYLRGLERLRDRVRCCRRGGISPTGLDRAALPLRGRMILLLAAALSPDENDRALLPLPPSLALLYHVVRPVRLAVQCLLNPARCYRRIGAVTGLRRSRMWTSRSA